MALVLALLSPVSCLAETLRIATWHADLSRDGPGLLLRDLERGTDPALAGIVSGIVAAAPDILVLTDIDFDHGHAALAALQAQLDAAGHALAHGFTKRPNSGWATGQDLDGNGRRGEARDAQGYGRFAGQGGVAVLSRWPIAAEGVTDLSALLWRDVPDSRMQEADTGREVQRLSSAVHWVVPVAAPHPVSVMVFHATPPVFDGPEDRNGRRNADEVTLWRHLLDGRLDAPPPTAPFVIAGNANADPHRGDGLRDAIAALLADPRLQDPAPHSPEAGKATVDWPADGPGQMRVSYVLPSAGLIVQSAGVAWETAAEAQRHKLVWVDLEIRPPGGATGPLRPGG